VDDVYSLFITPSIVGPCAVGSGGKRYLLLSLMMILYLKFCNTCHSSMQEASGAAALSMLLISGSSQKLATSSRILVGIENSKLTRHLIEVPSSISKRELMN
jgi:hypothetical protein